jgi:hypothetical protein
MVVHIYNRSYSGGRGSGKSILLDKKEREKGEGGIKKGGRKGKEREGKEKGKGKERKGKGKRNNGLCPIKEAE